MPQRPHDILDEPADLLRRQLQGGLAHGLVDDRDRPGIGVGVGDGQGNPLAVLIESNDDELAGLALLRDQRRFDHHSVHVSRDPLMDDYLVHVCAPLI